MADDHAGFVGDEDAFKFDVAAEDFQLESHAGEVFGWGGVAAVEVAVNYARDLAEDSGPSVFEGAVALFVVKDFVFAGVVGCHMEIIKSLCGNYFA